MKTPHELALAISAMINAKPRSPTIAELEGVIGEHWPEDGRKIVLSDKTEVLRRMGEILNENPRPARLTDQEILSALQGDGSIRDGDAWRDVAARLHELRFSNSASVSRLATKVLVDLQDAGVVYKPPMVAVSFDCHPDSISLGGAGWLPPKWIDPAEAA